MQFGNYIFRHNPEVISVAGGNRTVTHFRPGAGEICRNLGERASEVTCSGSFFGGDLPDAMGQLLAFRKTAADSPSATLFVPGLPPMRAVLRELAFDCRGDGRLIPYTMRFVEDAE